MIEKKALHTTVCAEHRLSAEKAAARNNDQDSSIPSCCLLSRGFTRVKKTANTHTHTVSTLSYLFRCGSKVSRCFFFSLASHSRLQCEWRTVSA
uniref:Uncharacterized protein n=1 Tax=Anopheles dirus TaxID=7168 RepID=A0A182NYW3_9DIPT